MASHFTSVHHPRYNCAPGQSVYCGILTSNHIRFGLLQWGIQPSWSKRRIINATWEKAAEPSGFWTDWKRCIVPSSGFYEWVKRQDGKQGYHIHSAKNPVLFFGGLWRWINPDSASLVILTTQSQQWMRNVHHRQPIILNPDDLLGFLSGEDPNLTVDFSMTLTPIGPFVNNVRNEGPQCWSGT